MLFLKRSFTEQPALPDDAHAQAQAQEETQAQDDAHAQDDAQEERWEELPEELREELWCGLETGTLMTLTRI